MERRVKIKTKKFKRVCDVSNCNCMDVYAIVGGKEFIRPVVLCKNCIKDIYEAVFPTPNENTAENADASEVPETAETAKTTTEATTKTTTRKKNTKAKKEV